MYFESIPRIDSPSVDKLISLAAASKLGAGDPSLFSFDNEVEEFASRFMGWVDLCTKPPVDPDEIMAFARDAMAQGLSDVVLIGMGGSSQAPMTVASILMANKRLPLRFSVVDTMDGHALSNLLLGLDPQTSMFIVSSKSGSTLEPNMISRCVFEYVASCVGYKEAARRFVAITDPGSSLEKLAKSQGYAAVFNGEPDVGGRFSAFSVFGLLPMALMGVDINDLLKQMAELTKACSADDISNPALALAAYLNEALLAGRDKICFNFSPSCSCLGFWIEQLIAESLGKLSKGMMPAIESDINLLSKPADDRCAVVYTSGIDDFDGVSGSALGSASGSDTGSVSASDRLKVIDSSIPALDLRIEEPLDVAAHFLLWEYTVPMIAALLKLNPFDQPNVESTKIAVKEILYKKGEQEQVDDNAIGEGSGDGSRNDSSNDSSNASVNSFVNGTGDDSSNASVNGTGNSSSNSSAYKFVHSFEISKAIYQDNADSIALDDALDSFFATIKHADFFAINSFLPETPQIIKVLQDIRHAVAKQTGCVSCLEIGPRYLHSVGQFQKGGPNKGVFLLLSAPESFDKDMQVPGESFTLGTIANAQAKGDFVALNEKNRRAMYVQLLDNKVATLEAFAERLCKQVSLRRS